MVKRLVGRDGGRMGGSLFDPRVVYIRKTNVSFVEHFVVLDWDSIELPIFVQTLRGSSF